MIRINVAGRPAPGGSKRGFYNEALGRTMMVDACARSKPWRQDVQAAAIPEMQGKPLMSGPLQVVATFYLQRPKSHYRTGKRANELRADAPVFHTSKPDATKLWRSTEDALSGIVWKDDAQVAIQTVTKLWAEKPGAEISVSEIPNDVNVAQ